MSNHRDGGRVIVGVKDEDGKLTPLGLSKDDLATWKRDDLADKVAVYAEPSPSFEVEEALYEENRYIVIEVSEFIDIPVICKKSYGDVLDEGACYVRPRRKPETTRIRTQEDMRDLLDLATEKKLRQHLSLSERVGIPVTSSITDQNLFDEQLADFEKSDSLKQLGASVFLKAVIRPTIFDSGRITKIATLETILNKCSVNSKSLQLPRQSYSLKVERKSDFIHNQSIDPTKQLEFWRFYQSGHFICYRRIPAIYGDNPETVPILQAESAVIWSNGVYELAARLASAEVEGDSLHIETGALNIGGCNLVLLSNPHLWFRGEYEASITRYIHSRDVSKIELTANAQELALEPARELLGRFGWDPEDRWMRDVQSKYL